MMSLLVILGDLTDNEIMLVNFLGMLIIIILVAVLFLWMGYRLIRSGARSKKTWKVILGVLLTGFIGYVYYANLREKIKDEQRKKEFEQLKAELSRINQPKASEKDQANPKIEK